MYKLNRGRNLMKKSLSKVKTLLSVALVFLLVFSMTACSSIASANKEVTSEETQDTIYDGVCISGIDVGGLSKDEAIEKVSSELKIPESIALAFSDKVREIPTSVIDVEADIENAVKNAMEVGRTGTEDEQQQEIQAVLSEPVNIALEYKCNEETLKDMLLTMKEETDNLDGEYKFDMDVEKTKDKIVGSLEAGSFDDITPVSAESENEEDEKTLLGSYSTSFSASDANRNENLRVACEKINGTVLQSGDIFDMNKLLGPQTSANGYKYAGVIENGKIVSAIAGGVCQVTTTMYNAAIFSELKILERHCHSLMVGYVPLGRDAAVAGSYKNLRFQNDTDYPVYIEAYIDNYKVVCNIYGHEIHDAGHSIDFEKVWVYTIPKPAEKVTVDPNMYEDERVVTYKGKTGAKVDTYKLVYENGELVSRTWFSSSTYSSTADEVTIGSKKREPVQSEIPVIGGESETTTPENTTVPEENTTPEDTTSEDTTAPATQDGPTTPNESDTSTDGASSDETETPTNIVGQDADAQADAGSSNTESDLNDNVDEPSSTNE